MIDGTESGVGKTITKHEYVILHGLRAISNRHNRELDLIASAVGEIVGEQKDGHAGDFTYCDNDTVDSLLSRLRISVEQADD